MCTFYFTLITRRWRRNKLFSLLKSKIYNPVLSQCLIRLMMCLICVQPYLLFSQSSGSFQAFLPQLYLVCQSWQIVIRCATATSYLVLCILTTDMLMTLFASWHCSKVCGILATTESCLPCRLSGKVCEDFHSSFISILRILVTKLFRRRIQEFSRLDVSFWPPRDP